MANHTFEGGDRVQAKDVISDVVHGQRIVFAEAGEELVIRSSDPLEASSLKRPLLSFNIQPGQVALLRKRHAS